MMFVVAIKEGGIACGAGCPYYEESGVVRGYGGPLKTHCRMVMNPWQFDCDKFNPKCMYVAQVPVEKVKSIEKALSVKFRRIRKLYPRDHKEIHPVGWKPSNH